jgi:magnesium-protoporphyrin IX monomethyl ester (oxidative) cyclase
MPFASIILPPLSLTQLRSVVMKELGIRVSVEILHLNHHFAQDIGINEYSFISEDHIELQRAGFGDWFFRQAAFPDLPDNTSAYLKRYGHLFGNEILARFAGQFTAMRERLNHYLDRLIETYRIDQADLVGFTSTFFQTLATAALANRIKAKNRNVVTVMGGANCETQMGRELVEVIANIDYVFSGPALISFPQLIRLLLEDRKEECESIDGVFTKQNKIRICGSIGKAIPQKKTEPASNQVGLLGRELDINVPIELDFDSFLDSFRWLVTGRETAKKPHLLFETSRGCWWGQKSHCTFCGLNGGTINYRAMEANTAREFVEDLFRRYAHRVDIFVSADNILPKEYLTDFLPQLNIPPNVSIFYEVKADLKEEEFKTLAKAHVFKVQPGIESLASSTLRLMRKGTTAFGNIQFLRWSVQYGIEPIWNLLVGFPGEGENVYEKYLEDMPLLTHLPPPTGAFPIRFDRFSPYFNLAGEYKLDLRPLDYYSFCYPSSGDALRNIAYYFYDGNFGAAYAVIAARFLQRLKEATDKWKVRWNAKDGQLPPRLYFKSDCRNIVYDSRSGIAIEHHLNETELVILKDLANPFDLEYLLATHPDLGRLEIEQTIATLSEKKVLFKEQNRWMSLVLPHIGRYQSNIPEGCDLVESHETA